MNRSRFSMRSTTKKIDRKPIIDRKRIIKNWLSMYRSNFFNIKFYEIVIEFDYNVAIIKWY
tara:strand:- start:252 stop:434 length:183 start_codon:yes stop_codon:yes gene_type:complete